MEGVFAMRATRQQPIATQATATPYIMAVTIIVVAFFALVFGILYIRPQMDVLLLFGGVGTLATVLMGQSILFIKQRETAIKVNGVLHELMDARSAQDRAEGAREGAAQEQARVAEQRRVSALTAGTLAPGVVPVPSTPIPVVVANETPIPVVQEEKR